MLNAYPTYETRRLGIVFSLGLVFNVLFGLCLLFGLGLVEVSSATSRPNYNAEANRQRETISGQP